jgi:hypothetical protein
LNEFFPKYGSPLIKGSCQRLRGFKIFKITKIFHPKVFA